MIDLPLKIWARIAEHLEGDDLASLYGVNRTTRNLALNARYQQVSFRSHNKQGKWFLHHLACPRNAARVRTFHLSPNNLSTLIREGGPATNTKHPGERKWGILQRLASPSRSRQSKGLMVKDQLTSITENMTSLQALTIEASPLVSGYFDFVKVKPRVLDGAWTTYARTLRHLKLTVPIEALDVALPPRTVHFRHLESLDLHILRAYPETKAELLLLSTVVPFISRHSLTLRSLCLHGQDAGNPTSILQYLSFMTACTSFSITTKLWSEMTGLYRFLHLHRAQLRHVKVKLLASRSFTFDKALWRAQPWLRVPMHKLERLDLDFGHVANNCRQTIVAYVLQRRATLSHLRLASIYLSIPEAKSLMDGLGGDMMKELELCLLEFCPSLLECSSKCLPNLERLGLLQATGGLGIDDAVRWTYDICTRLKDRCYSDWGLRILNTNPLHPDRTARRICKTALLEALPNVEIFCGLTRKEYVKTDILV